MCAQPDLSRASPSFGRNAPTSLTRLFDESLPKSTDLSALPYRDPSLLVSEPERELLELASDVGKRRAKGQSLEEAINIASSLRNFRPKVLDALLSHCTRVKVVKPVRDLDEPSEFPWGQGLQRHVDRPGAGRRWTSSPQGGPLLNLEA